MIYRLYGMAASFVFICGLAAYSAIDRTTNYKPAKASVFLVDRKCDIVETTRSGEGPSSTRIYNGDCKSIEAWDKAKARRDKGISGEAIVQVSYTAPQDGSYHTSSLKFSTRDDEFYDLHAGSEINILVSNSDHDKIRKS
jgi:hypothetical protein